MTQMLMIASCKPPNSVDQAKHLLGVDWVKGTCCLVCLVKWLIEVLLAALLLLMAQTDPLKQRMLEPPRDRFYAPLLRLHPCTQTADHVPPLCQQSIQNRFLQL